MPFPSRPLAWVAPPLCGLTAAYLRASISHEEDSHVEADVEDVTVLDDIRLSLEPLSAGPRSRRVASRLDEIVPAHNLAADEAARNVGVDRLRRVEGGLATPERPGPCLLLARGEERDQVERLREPAYDLSERGLASAAELRRLRQLELSQLSLELEVDAGCGCKSRRQSRRLAAEDRAAFGGARTVDEFEQRLRRQRLELGGQLALPLRPR